MAFPSLAAAPTTSSSTTSTTPQSISLPASVSAGDLVVVLFATDSGGGTISWPGSWVEKRLLSYTSSRLSIGMLDAAGGETSVSISFSGAGERHSSMAFRIPAAEWGGNLTTDVYVSAGATDTSGSNANPNPDNATPGWGALDILWIACVGWDNSTGGNAVSAWPTNYSSNQTSSPDISSAGRCAIATRNLNGSSDDAGTFTITADEWGACTIAVKPSGGSPASLNAGPNTITFTAPSGTSRSVSVVSRDAGTNTFTVTAPTAVLHSFIGLAAGTNTVTLTSPTATLTVSGVSTAAGTNTITFTAPVATLTTSGGSPATTTGWAAVQAVIYFLLGSH